MVAEAARVGGAKERRRLLKAMKGHSLQLLTHRDAYLPFIKLVEVTDDTVNVQKSLLDELSPHASDAATPLAANPFLVEEEEADDEDDPDVPSGPLPPLLEVLLDRNASKLLLRLLAPNNKKYFDPDELATLDVLAH